jgi:hypothetical protein
VLGLTFSLFASASFNAVIEATVGNRVGELVAEGLAGRGLLQNPA